MPLRIAILAVFALSVSACASQQRVTSTPSTTTTPTAQATEAPVPPTPPPGYETSCAARSIPWTAVVRDRYHQPNFICLDSPQNGEVSGTTVNVRGWAAYPFDANVVIEARTESGTVIAQVPTVVGLPASYPVGWFGAFEKSVSLPPDQIGRAVTIRAYFGSPRGDGLPLLRRPPAFGWRLARTAGTRRRGRARCDRRPRR